ncbi:hypothetical protein [Streptomyces sp. NPDC127040]|uniref:DUF6197 family protein n=1 Tax=Streptomyces sp. NPDC127040 TaxID=3347116 RepID=UPI0036655925
MPGSAVETPVVGAAAAGPPLTLDERFALAGLAMDHRLAYAGAAIAVSTAHIDIPEILVDPLPATAPAPATVDAVLREAGRLITKRGWCRRWLTDGTALCARGAIQAAAGGEGALADDAEAALYAAIEREQPGAYLSVPDWNDQQTGAAAVIRMLNR